MIDKEDKNKAKNSIDRNPDEIIELLENFYQVEDSETEDFDLFFDSIEQKITEQNPANRISKIGDDIENNINLREQKLSRFLRRLEQKNGKTKKKPKSNKPKLKQIVGVIVVLTLIALASFANLDNFKSYNYISLEGDDINWQILELDENQRNKLKTINDEWISFKTTEENLINHKRSNLLLEMNSTNPNFALIDKYQREILDHEVILKRQKLNVFLEKRFILNEEQSLKLIREISKKAK